MFVTIDFRNFDTFCESCHIIMLYKYIMYMYICICVWVCAYVYACVYIYVCVSDYAYYVYVCAYAQTISKEQVCWSKFRAKPPRCFPTKHYFGEATKTIFGNARAVTNAPRQPSKPPKLLLCNFEAPSELPPGNFQDRQNSQHIFALVDRRTTKSFEVPSKLPCATMKTINMQFWEPSMPSTCNFGQRQNWKIGYLWWGGTSRASRL